MLSTALGTPPSGCWIRRNKSGTPQRFIHDVGNVVIRFGQVEF
jgi:hypothetical protein